jgi:UDP-N-acetylglucosamine 2-epimerase
VPLQRCEACNNGQRWNPGRNHRIRNSRFTISENTERPITITEGTNTLVGSDREKILKESFRILNGKGKKGKIPKLWDGKASERIVNILLGRPYNAFKPEGR